MSLHIFSLYSGSSGNSFLFANETAEGTNCILIDGGKNAKRLCAAIAECGYSPAEVRAVFVTHEHSDHISALPVFARRYDIPVHAVGETAFVLATAMVEPSLIISHPAVFQAEVGGFSVYSFPTPHDSRASVGYRIEVETDEGVCKIGYATDMGILTETVEENLLGCNCVILESNHDVERLMTGPYPYYLKNRIRGERGHLSNADCADLAERLAESGTKKIMLAHLSRQNNTPELAYNATAARLEGTDVELLVAAPEKVVQLL